MTIEDEELEEEAPEPILPGVARALSPLVRRILAPNAGPLTGPGTNTYLVGIDEIAVIDPGPNDPAHLDSICGCGGDRIRWVICTSDHPEHIGAAEPLKERTGAEILGAAKCDAVELDAVLKDGQTIVGTEFRLTIKSAPGLTPCGIALLLEEERLLFTSDLVVEEGEPVVVPPKGDMADYLATLESFTNPKWRLARIAPAYGHILDDPKITLAEYIDRYTEQEAEILGVLKDAESSLTPADLLPLVRPDLDDELADAATSTIEAHLVKLGADKLAKGRKGAWTAA